MNVCRSFPFQISLAVILLVGCEKSAPPPPRPPHAVSVAKTEAHDVPAYLDEIGNCTAYETVMIQPQVSGVLVGIHFNDGAEIKKNDLLFTIDPRPYQAALDRAKATLAQDRAKAAYDEAQFVRTDELRKTKVVAPQEYDSAKSSTLAAKATVEADEAAVETAQIARDYCEIRSPIDGRASKRMVDLGNVVAVNSTQLLLIQRQDPIYVDFTIPEGSLPAVRHYQETHTLAVEASFADDPKKCGVGDLDFLDSGVQQNSGTVRMRGILENKNRLFWPGQFVRVRLLLDSLKNAVLAPAEAVQVGDKGPFVFVVKADSTVELRAVTPGQRQGESVVISDGLKPGETVVVTGQLALAPGATVVPVPMETTTAKQQ